MPGTKAESKTSPLAHPLPGEEIVISGLAGHYPDSHNVNHFRDNLFNKVDMVSSESRRWEHVHPEIPKRTGMVYNLHKFDASFFGLSNSQSDTSDPLLRMTLERAVEAIFDAGIHPDELKGTKTGVYVGVCFSESEKVWFFDRIGQNGTAITGLERSMVAHRVSYYLKLSGPSYITDTACSSSLYAMEHAYRDLRTGVCDKAIVAGANLCLHPFVSLQFARLGVLSQDGACKCFDTAGDGYARSEAICAIVLERAKDARRIYGTVVHAKTNCDGYKPEGITFPSGEMQQTLLEEFYEECNVDPLSLTFLEAHGTGTKVGDPQEIDAIDKAMCKNRTVPLLIGSVKSSIGHSEPSSGMCSLTKCIIAMENEMVPPNLHFKSPREGLKALEQGKLKVVTECTPLKGEGLLGINSFGFGGGNCHILLRWNKKQKVNKGLPKDDLPRLVVVSGRTKKAVKTFFKHISTGNFDAEYFRLLHQLFSKDILCHVYRGYMIVSKNGVIKQDFDFFSGKLPNLHVAFGCLYNSWQNLAGGLLEYSNFKATLQRIQHVLESSKVNILKIMTGTQLTPLENILGGVSVGIAIIDILKDLGLKPKGYITVSYGQLLAAYYDGLLTLEKTILSAYVIGKNTPNPPEKVVYYQIELPLEKIKQNLPEKVDIIAVISERSAIIGGNEKTMNNYVNNLKAISVKCKEVSSNILVISKNSFLKNKSLHEELTQIIGAPKRWSTPLMTGLETFSAETLINNMINPIFIPNRLEQIIIEESFLDLGTGFISKCWGSESQALEKCIVPIGNNEKFNFSNLLELIGRLYIIGLNPTVHKLYPEVPYPVSKGTPMISPSIRWNWSQDWFVCKYDTRVSVKNGQKVILISGRAEGWSFILGHVIDGRNLVPATCYLQLVWETLAYINGVIISDMKIVFENCRFLRASTLLRDNVVELTVMVQRASGSFEVIEGDQTVVKGIVKSLPINDADRIDLPLQVGVDNDDYLPMTKKDIYKELRLRGYNYRGEFRAVENCNAEATRGSIKWTGNWITFMDNMLQMKILQIDTRLLYVPTGIKKLTINAKKHLELWKNDGQHVDVPVYLYKDIDIIRTDAIEIQGLNAASIALRRPLGTPVLEKYEFVPNICSLNIHHSVRVNMQIILENLFSIKVKVVEFLDEASTEGVEILSPIIQAVLGDLPLIQPNLTVLTNDTELKLNNITVENRKLTTESDCHLIVGSCIFKRNFIHDQVFTALKENAFVLSREAVDMDLSTVDPSFTIFTVHQMENEKLILFRKKIEVKEYTSIEISDANLQFNWLEKLKTAVKNDEHIIAFAQDHPTSGILGLINCLRREPGGGNIKTFFIMDQGLPKFNMHEPMYSEQLSKSMAINVYKDGCWGTYRHLLLDEAAEVESEHCFVNVTTKGDLSSLKWIEGPLKNDHFVNAEQSVVHIYYSALNFRDVMTAVGRISADVITMDRTEQECVQGFEFSGRDNSGKRVMGMINKGALATMVMSDTSLTWEVPDHWTLEEAATVPVVYATVIYALVTRGHMKRSDKILIHSGSGGVGQAAIHFALHFGCQVYTTVGTEEKREFLKKRFPQLKDHHIGNSRDASFETMIKNQTNGRGVDIVLNSLAEEKLQASVRCLARGGRFLEIGKFDLATNNTLQLQFLEKEASFHGVMLDHMFNESPAMKRSIRATLTHAINEGSVVPLSRTVFQSDEIEKAFRFMTSGKHMGKVLIKVREPEKEIQTYPGIKKFKGIPRYSCNPNNSFIIIGGLGGFGLELADWLVLRGARKLVLTSRSGIKTGYQSLRIRTWKSYGATIKISTADVKTKEGCVQLFKEADSLGPVEGLFNLAVVLKDALFENQNPETFTESFGPKAVATINLDEISRRMCPNLRDFVIFSSVSCGRGNSGQTNYGMANSVMERICEKRKNEGYPALAIQWGAIGEVGLVAEMQEESFEMEIGGTLQQRISNCLKVLDVFLRQSSPVVGSMVVAEKRGGAGSADNIVDAVANILGIRDLKSISLHSPLAELGMDSMTAVEIKQTLEREYDVFLTAQDIRGMTFAKLKEIQENQESNANKEKALMGMDMLVRLMGDEGTCKIPFVTLESNIEEANGKKILFFPGLEGIGSVLTPLTKNLKAEIVSLQYSVEDQADTVVDMASSLLENTKKHISKEEPFIIIGFSFGAIVALEVIGMLEKEGYEGKFISLDGAPAQQVEISTMLDVASANNFETSLALHLFALYVPFEVIAKQKEEIFRCNGFEAKIKKAQEYGGDKNPHDPHYQLVSSVALYKRIKGLLNYKPSYEKISSKTSLFKPKLNSMHIIKDDYKLSQMLNQEVDVRIFEGNHLTILNNEDMAKAINEIVHGKVEEEAAQTKEPNESGDK